MELLLIIITSIVAGILGLKAGLEMVACELYNSGSINADEFEYRQSWKYLYHLVKTLLKNDEQ